MRQDDQAIAAFQKQIEVNPYDEFAYNNLGRVYWNERKYDDAVKAFNKQLENNPLDKFAHANLGAMYAEWHKYDLAVAELEKAASLTPDSPDLQVSLGECLPESRPGRQGAGRIRSCRRTRRHAAGVEQHRLPAFAERRSSRSRAAVCRIRRVGDRRRTAQRFPRPPLAKRLAAGFVADRLLGHAGLGPLRAKAISTKRKNTSPPPGNLVTTAKWAIISGRSMKSAARKIAPCAPMRSR